MDSKIIKILDNSYFDFTAEQLDFIKTNNRSSAAALSPYATKCSDAVYFDNRSVRTKDEYTNPFIVDCDRILNNTFYNRYIDKTQVFSFYKNDDITRRGSHVQLVSRIARTIGNALNLNLDLIEAISLGHDLGHAPFGHQGEKILNDLYHGYTGRYFNHNIHSFRILHSLTNKDGKHGLTMQSLDGIVCHNGEKVEALYHPQPCTKRDLLAKVIKCYTDPKAIKMLKPSTLEGCVVRVSDMIAYIGKDRQDLIKAGKSSLYNELPLNPLGKSNPDIMPKLIRNLIKNSIDKPYIGFDKEVHLALYDLKKDNYDVIYAPDSVSAPQYKAIREMMSKLYEKFRKDLTAMDSESSIFKHHITNKLINYHDLNAPDEVVTDYIASMTDDYLIDIYRFYFGEDKTFKAITYIPYEYDLKK